MFCKETQVTETQGTASASALHTGRWACLYSLLMSAWTCLASHLPTCMPAAQQHSDAFSSSSARPASFATRPHRLEKSPVGGDRASWYPSCVWQLHSLRETLLFKATKRFILSPWFWPKKVPSSSPWIQYLWRSSKLSGIFWKDDDQRQFKKYPHTKTIKHQYKIKTKDRFLFAS